MAKNIDLSAAPDALFLDAGFLIAYFAISDQYHRRALKLRLYLAKKEIRLFTCWPCVSEAATLLLYHYGFSAARGLFAGVAAFEVILPSEADYREAMVLFGKFSKNQKLSFNDMVVYVLIRRLKNIPLLTFDRAFSKIGLTVFVP